VVAAPSPVALAVDSGDGVVDTRSPEVEREEECASGWSGASSEGNLIGGRFLAKVEFMERGGV
jgi:hypothetical protein